MALKENKDMQEFLEEIEKLRQSGKLIIVEGKKDIKALSIFGVKAVEINGPLEIFAEKIAKEHKEIVLLTDLDPTGRKLYSRLNHYFSQLGVKVNNDFRNYLYRNTKLRQIEGIKKYIENYSCDLGKAFFNSA